MRPGPWASSMDREHLLHLVRRSARRVGSDLDCRGLEEGARLRLHLRRRKSRRAGDGAEKIDPVRGGGGAGGAPGSDWTPGVCTLLGSGAVARPAVATGGAAGGLKAASFPPAPEATGTANSAAKIVAATDLRSLACTDRLLRTCFPRGCCLRSGCVTFWISLRNSGHPAQPTDQKLRRFPLQRRFAPQHWNCSPANRVV